MRDERSLEQKLEAMLTVALEPITTEELADVVDEDAEFVLATLRTLRAEFVEERRGFQLAELASGWSCRPPRTWRVGSPSSPTVTCRIGSAPPPSRHSQSSPIDSQSRARRSRRYAAVNVDGVVRLLEQRGYIEEKGRASGPGLPILYGTTELFLDRMGLAGISDLPPIEEFMPPVATANELADELFESSLELAEDA